MELEFLTERVRSEECYHFDLVDGDDGVAVDWAPMISEIVGDLANRRDRGAIAAKFHNTAVEMIVAAARRCGEERVVLSGGCFQNRYLTERAVRRLGEAGFRPYWHQRVPPNDGGIALGQVVAVSRRKADFKQGLKPDFISADVGTAKAVP
jgi:hydrogenase maturation protein HypF